MRRIMKTTTHNLVCGTGVGHALVGKKGLPTKPVIMSVLGKLKSAGILMTVRAGSGRRPQIYAFPELVNLCEGRKVL
jgi:hypothetical protein